MSACRPDLFSSEVPGLINRGRSRDARNALLNDDPAADTEVDDDDGLDDDVDEVEDDDE
jgi:hypothetical protein